MIDQIWIISNDINENKNKVNVIFHFQGKYIHTRRSLDSESIIFIRLEKKWLQMVLKLLFDLSMRVYLSS